LRLYLRTLTASSGSWTYSTLYNFTCSQGDHAGHTMVMDTSGNLYGVGQGGWRQRLWRGLRIESGVRRGWTYTCFTISHWPKAAGLKSVWSPTQRQSLRRKRIRDLQAFCQRRRHLDRERSHVFTAEEVLILSGPVIRLCRQPLRHQSGGRQVRSWHRL